MSKTKPLCFILTVLTMTLLLGYLAFAWQDPTQAPPGDNVPVPINVGPLDQAKIGRIGHLGSGAFGSTWDKWAAIGIPNLGVLPNSSSYYGLKVSWDSDAAFFGLRDYGANRKDAIVGWGDDAADNLRFQFNHDDRMIITSAGNVGIGTASPAQKLHVANYIRADQGFCIGTNCITSWPATGAPVGASYVVMSLDGTLTNERRLTAGSGISVSDGGANSNVTVSADTSYLQRRVTGSCPSDSAIRIINADGTVSCVTVGTGTVSGSGTTNYIPYWTGSTSLGNSVIYQSAGAYVGIGTTGPNDKLTVAGNVTPSSANTGQVGTATYYWNQMNAGAYYYRSDINFKENIEPLNEALEKILQLKGVSFQWIDSKEESIGLIAQDVEKFFPEIINTDSETGIKSLDYSRLVAPLIEATKEQQKEIEQLKEKIQELELKIK